MKYNIAKQLKIDFIDIERLSIKELPWTDFQPFVTWILPTPHLLSVVYIDNTYI